MVNPKEADLERVEESLKVFGEHRDRLRRELGINGDGGITTAETLKEEDEAATLLDRMTSAEILHLFETNHEKWKELMEAKERAGFRKLFGRGPR
jgi:hypothetical protein